MNGKSDVSNGLNIKKNSTSFATCQILKKEKTQVKSLLISFDRSYRTTPIKKLKNQIFDRTTSVYKKKKKNFKKPLTKTAL